MHSNTVAPRRRAPILESGLLVLMLSAGAADADGTGARSARLGRAKAEVAKSVRAAPTQPNIHPRIIGGRPAADREIPWQGAVVYKSELGIAPTLHCGAAFVRPNIVITAAHCITDADPDYDQKPHVFGNMGAFEVVSGSTTLGGADARRHRITDVIGHPRYDIVSHDYDFALLRVDPPFAGQTLDILSEADSDAMIPGTNTQVSGWGVTNNATGQIAVGLQKLDVPLVARNDCNAKARR